MDRIRPRSFKLRTRAKHAGGDNFTILESAELLISAFFCNAFRISISFVFKVIIKILY